VLNFSEGGDSVSDVSMGLPWRNACYMFNLLIKIVCLSFSGTANN
jgi:hypothetical protein